MSFGYKLFSEEQIARARATDLVSLLRSQGELLKRSGNEYVWRDGSNKVTVNGNLWYHQYDQEGGDAIEFVKRFYNKSFPDAIRFLIGEREGVLQAEPIPRKEASDITLPERNDNMKQVYAYLIKRRGIDKNVIDAFVRNRMLYESAEHHNAVFVGFDRAGRPSHAHMRGTGLKSTYKVNAENSDPEYSFHWHGADEKLYIFEAPIDMLSFICMNPDRRMRHSYAAACSTSDKVLFRMLADNPALSHVFLCYDNDEAGQAAAARTQQKLSAEGIEAEILVPKMKDWNEDLLKQHENLKKQKGRYSELYVPEFLELFTTEPIAELSADQSAALKRMARIVSELTSQQRDIFFRQASRKRVYWKDRQLILPEDVDADLVAFQIVYTFWNRFNSTPEKYEEGLARSGELGALLRLLKEQDSN